MSLTISSATEVTPLVPRTTRLDERVLAALNTDTGRRAGRVAQLVHGCPAWRCDTCEHFNLYSHNSARRPLAWEALKPRRCLISQPGHGWCEDGRQIPVLFVTDDQAREVREVLRGLERVGKASQSGGWWRRVA